MTSSQQAAGLAGSRYSYDWIDILMVRQIEDNLILYEKLSPMHIFISMNYFFYFMHMNIFILYNYLKKIYFVRLVGPGGAEQHCCLLDNGKRCLRPAGNASYSKRIQKTVTQRNMKLSLDPVNEFKILTHFD